MYFTLTDASSDIFSSMDVDPPLIVDDEYWTPCNLELAFRQPHGIPSHVEAFGFWLTLTKISAFAVRTLVCGLARSCYNSNPISVCD